jgi:Spy/CpxP family protein refolding chaperone
MNKIMFSKKLLLPVLLVGMVSSASVIAKPFGGERCSSHMEQRLDHMIDYLDLSEEQEQKAEKIFDALKESKFDKQSRKNRQYMMSLNPGDADYLKKVAEYANQKAEHIKLNIMEMAKAKQSLYEILDDSQKEKMAKMAERRMKKTNKRMLKKGEN